MTIDGEVQLANTEQDTYQRGRASSSAKSLFELVLSTFLVFLFEIRICFCTNRSNMNVSLQNSSCINFVMLILAPVDTNLSLEEEG